MLAAVGPYSASSMAAQCFSIVVFLQAHIISNIAIYAETFGSSSIERSAQLLLTRNLLIPISIDCQPQRGMAVTTSATMQLD
jgi:hypothetical protein